MAAPIDLCFWKCPPQCIDEHRLTDARWPHHALDSTCGSVHGVLEALSERIEMLQEQRVWKFAAFNRYA
ncbi:hypothetical protein D9M69_401470 [compost metagenome]